MEKTQEEVHLVRIFSKKKVSKFIACMVVALLLIPNLAAMVSAAIIPPALEFTLEAGETTSTTSSVVIPGYPAKADVIFAFDLTGSMSGIINEAKDKALQIMEQLDATGVDINYAVVSYMDYPNSYDSYGYAAEYGDSYYGDYAYQLNKPITNDRTAVSNAINSLEIGSGSDGPQDYTRILYESYADSAVRWRSGAKKIIVNFGDCVPHDNNINEGIPGYDWSWSTGGDPGRDEIMFTADDLDLQTVLAEMAAQNVSLIACQSYGSFLEYWSQWAGITGGQALSTSSSSLVADVVNSITSELTTPVVNNLHLQASTGFESWLEAVVPSSYNGPTGVTVNFNTTFKVPIGTLGGDYNFYVDAVDSTGVSYGQQAVTIHVGSDTCTHQPVFTWLPLLIDGIPADINSGDILPIKFHWGCPHKFVKDQSVTVRVRNARTNALIAGYTYGAGIAIDETAKEYCQQFDTNKYKIQPGSQLKVMVYFGGKLKGTALVNVN
jgi:hypothetical protein